MLDVLAKMISIDMKANAVIVLTRDWETIYVYRNLLIRAMVDCFDRAKSAMLSISSGEKVCIDIQTSGQRQPIVRHRVVLMCLDPPRFEWALEVS